MTILALAQRFVNGATKGNVHNARIDGNEYKLHGHVICKRIEGSLAFNWCGWYTPTTANHMNQLLLAAGANQRVSYSQACKADISSFTY